MNFEAKPHGDTELARFDIGTVNGLYRVFHGMIEVVAIANDEPGNGQLDDAFEWFAHMCKEKKKGLRIMHIRTNRFHDHLVDKRGFISDGADRVVKYFK